MFQCCGLSATRKTQTLSSVDVSEAAVTLQCTAPTLGRQERLAGRRRVAFSGSARRCLVRVAFERARTLVVGLQCEKLFTACGEGNNHVDNSARTHLRTMPSQHRLACLADDDPKPRKVVTLLGALHLPALRLAATQQATKRCSSPRVPLLLYISSNVLLSLPCCWGCTVSCKGADVADLTDTHKTNNRAAMRFCDSLDVKVEFAQSTAVMHACLD